MRKITAICLTLFLLLSCAGSGGAAAEAQGDVTVWYADSRNGTAEAMLTAALLWKGQAACFTEGRENRLLLYDPETRTSKEYSMEDAAEALRLSLGEDAPDSLETECWFVWDDRLTAIMTAYDAEERPEGGLLAALSLEGETPVLSAAGLPRLDWRDMTEESGGWTGSRPVLAAFPAGNRLCIQTVNDLEEGRLCLFDLTDGSCEVLEPEGLLAAAPGPEGRLILLREAGPERTLSLADPLSGAEEILSTVPAEGDTPANLCYRPENHTLYYTAGGEILAAPDLALDRAFAVNACPTGGENTAAWMTANGFLLLWDARSAVLRGTDPAGRREVSLLVRDYAELDALDSAAHAYSAAYGDVSVRVERADAAENLLQAMMNQDASVDVYCLDMATGSFSALFERGYPAPLDGSGLLTAHVDAMYPAVAEAVRRDGKLLALPVQAWGYTLGIHLKAFEALGWTEADIPTTWDGFFDLLDELPARVEGSGVRIFQERLTAETLQKTLFRMILSGWLENTDAADGSVFNAPELESLLRRLAGLDLQALEVSGRTGSRGGSDSFRRTSSVPLFETGTALTLDSLDMGYVPMLLSFREGRARAAYHMTVAFVNPYSAHAQEAVGFLETLAGHVDTASAYTFSPEGNEPVRTPEYEQNYASLTETLEQARAQMAGAEDESLRERWQGIAESLEKSLKQLDETSWSISPEAIEAYQARAGQLVPMVWDFSRLMTDSSDASLTEAMNRFWQGDLGARELLETIDRKYRMQLLEGGL